MSASANTTLIRRARRRREAYPFHCSTDGTCVARYLNTELLRPTGNAIGAIHLAPVPRRRFSYLSPPADCRSFNGAVRVVNDHIVGSKAPNCFLPAHGTPSSQFVGCSSTMARAHRVKASLPRHPGELSQKSPATLSHTSHARPPQKALPFREKLRGTASDEEECGSCEPEIARCECATG
jgi:hypothetical protein